MGKEITVAGRKVVLRDHFPARHNWDLPQLISALAPGKGEVHFENAPALMVRMIESWEFEGDPSDPAVYADMDMLSELMPLANAVAEVIRQAIDSGEAG